MRIVYAFFALVLPILNLSSESFAIVAEEIVETGAFLNRFGLCAATSSNLSRRLEGPFIAMAASGKHKGALTHEDIVILDFQGNSQGSTHKISAEAPLHLALYEIFQEIGAVIHTHSVNGIVLTKIFPSAKTFVTEGYEMHKAFSDIRTHESQLEIPIFENSQNIAVMAAEVSAYLENHPKVYGFLIRGHGFYTEVNSKVGNLARKRREFLRLERATIVQAQGASEDRKFAAKLKAAKNQLLSSLRYTPGDAICKKPNYG